MSLSYAHGAIQWLAGDALNTTYTVNGLSFQPKALRFSTNGLQNAADAVSSTVSGARSIGFAVSTSSRRSVATYDNFNSASSDCGSIANDDCVIATVWGNGSREGAVDLNSITSDGFVLIVDNQGVQNTTIFWEAWGGSDITVAVVGDIAEPAATGNQDYTVTGFAASATDQVVMFAGVQSTAELNTGSATDSGLHIGYATSGTAADNITICGNADDASPTMDTNGYCKTGECLSMIVVAGGNPNATAQLTQFGTDNFRLNWTARALTNRRNIFLAIKGGSWTAGSLTIDGATSGATATISGLSYTPVGLSVIGRTSVESTAGTSVAQDKMLWGCGTSTTDRRSMGYWDENNTANVEIDLVIQYDQILSCPTVGGALGAIKDISTMNSDGFTLICDDAAGVASEWIGYLTFGNAVSSGVTTEQVTTTSFAITPTNIGSLYKHVSQIATVAFAITTATISSLHNYKTTVDSSSFIVTPSVISSLHHNKTQIESASFTIAPNVISSLHNYKDTVESIVFSLTSSNIDSIYSSVKTSQTESAVFLVTPNVISSLYDKVSKIDTGIYAVTPSVVGSAKSFVGQIDTATYTITPSSVEDRYNHKDSILTTSYLITPSSVNSIVPISIIYSLEQLITIKAESRGYIVLAESKDISMETEYRGYIVEAEQRSYVVEVI